MKVDIRSHQLNYSVIMIDDKEISCNNNSIDVSAPVNMFESIPDESKTKNEEFINKSLNMKKDKNKKHNLDEIILGELSQN